MSEAEASLETWRAFYCCVGFCVFVYFFAKAASSDFGKNSPPSNYVEQEEDEVSTDD